MEEMDYTTLITDSSSPEWVPPDQFGEASESLSVETPILAAPIMDGPGQTEKCPTCERTLPKPHKADEPRERKSWTIAVPVDERENGAEVLDTLLVECRTLFGHDTNPKVRYYTVAQALALVVQNSTQLAADDAA